MILIEEEIITKSIKFKTLNSYPESFSITLEELKFMFLISKLLLSVWDIYVLEDDFRDKVSSSVNSSLFVLFKFSNLIYK